MRDKQNETQARGIHKAQDYRALKRSIFLIGFILPVLPLLVVGGVLFVQVHTLEARRAQAHVAEVVRSAGEAVAAWQEREERLLVGLLTAVADEPDVASPSLDGVRPVFEVLGGSFSALELVDSGNAILDRVGSWPETARRRMDGDETVLPPNRVNPNVVWRWPVASGLVLETSRLCRGEVLTLRGWIDGAAIARATAPGGFERSVAVAFLIQGHVVFAQKRSVDAVPRDHTIPWDSECFASPDDGNRLVRQIKDGSGHVHFVACLPVREGAGVVVVQQPQAEALADYRKVRRLFGILVFAMGLGIGLYAFNLSRQMVRRIQEADRRKQQMIEKMFQTGKLASIGELAAGIAHEINNPVAIMVEEAGWIGDLLGEEEFSNGHNFQEISRALNQIRSQGRRCKDITQKLLSFARETDFTTRRTDVAQLVADTLAMAAEKAKQQSVAMTAEIPQDLPSLFLPDTEFQQVLLNLINNGLDAIQDGPGQLTISVSMRDERLVLQVRDTGVGISPEHLPRIFDPFFTTKPVGKGTGLGLSICYGIVDKMGGTIRADSQIGLGSTFRVSVPVRVSQIEITHPSDRIRTTPEQDGSHG